MAGKFVLEQVIMDMNNWKQTRKKTGYSIYMCIPPVGTKIHNVLEQMDYVTGKNDVVLSGTREELWVDKLSNVMKTYNFVDKGIITVPKITQMKRLNCLPWTRIEPKASKMGADFALFVPKQHKNIVLPNGYVVNCANVSHGIGDFLVAANVGGTPDIDNIRVVNGEIFVDTYDMRTFTGLVVNAKQVIDAPYPKINLLPQNIMPTMTTVQEDKNEIGHVETEDFNVIAYRTFEHLTKHYDKYSYEIVDVVSNYKDITKNYAKIDVLKDDKAVARLIMSIDTKKFIILVIKSRLDGKLHTIKADSIKEMTKAIQQFI